MNPIQKLSQWLSTYLPECRVQLDRPKDPAGLWYLDVSLHEHPVTVQWKPQKGFGISASPKSGYGEGPDETFTDLDSAIRRVLSLLLLRQNTRPPRPVRLAELRRARNVPQVMLAKKLKKGQASISKAESRGKDVLVSTLSAMIEAMGGRLSVRAQFPDGVERELTFDR